MPTETPEQEQIVVDVLEGHDLIRTETSSWHSFPYWYGIYCPNKGNLQERGRCQHGVFALRTEKDGSKGISKLDGPRREMMVNPDRVEIVSEFCDSCGFKDKVLKVTVPNDWDIEVNLCFTCIQSGFSK